MIQTVVTATLTLSQQALFSEKETLPLPILLTFFLSESIKDRETNIQLMSSTVIFIAFTCVQSRWSRLPGRAR